MGATGFLPPSAVAAIHRDVRRGFQTVLDLQDPPVYAVLRGYEGGELVIDPPVRVAIDFGGQQPREAYTEGARETETTGRIRAWAEWSVRKDQTFDLADGSTARIVNVPPAKYGIQAAAFVVEV
jgi:hypothetical protein